MPLFVVYILLSFFFDQWFPKWNTWIPMGNSKRKNKRNVKIFNQNQFLSHAFCLMLLSHFSHVRLCVTPEMAAHQAPPSLGFSRQEHWSGLPFPSAMHESKKWKWSRSVLSDPQRLHGLQPTRLLRPWDFPGKSTRVGCHLGIFQDILILRK